MFHCSRGSGSRTERCIRLLWPPDLDANQKHVVLGSDVWNVLHRLRQHPATVRTETTVVLQSSLCQPIDVLH